MSASPPPELIQHPTAWCAPELISVAERPACWGWLTEVRSLSERIAIDLGRPVEVERIAETELPESGALWRRVRLHCAGAARVYAESRIPYALRAETRWPSERPIGERLFAVPDAARLALEVARLPPHDTFVGRAVEGTDLPARSLWARRSHLRAAGASVLIVECLL